MSDTNKFRRLTEIGCSHFALTVDDLDSLYSTLKEQGIEVYESLGKEFDTKYHEALMTKRSKKQSNVIIEEFEKGYKYYDRVIRHAKVVVSK